LFAVSAAVTLAIGIAVNTIMFTLLNSLALRPMPVRHADRLVRLYPVDADGHRQNLFSYPDYLDYRDASVLDGVTAYIPSSVTARVAANEAEDLIGYIVAPNYFTLLGIEPSLGRAFIPADERAADPAVAVISHSFWRRRFASDPAVIGSSLVINNRRFTIIGVGPSRFSGTEPLSPDVWVTLAVQRTMLPPHDLANDRSTPWLLVIGRLKATISKAAAASALSSTARNLSEAFPGRDRPSSIVIAPGTFFTLDAGIWPLIILVLSTVALILAIACANVGNLVLARTSSRQREIAVRLAIGASRWRVVRHLMAESVVISLAGGGLGLLLATWTLDLLYPLGLSFVPPELGSVVLDLSPDLHVFGYTFGLALAAGLLLGLAPALQSSSPRLAGSLHDDGAMVGLGVRPSRLRSALVILQVAVCLVLLVGAGLLARGLQHAQALDVGFRTTGVLYTEYDLRRHGYTADRAQEFNRGIADAAAAGGPVALTSHVPLHGGVKRAAAWPEGHAEPVTSTTTFISPSYFDTLSIPVTRGRFLTRRSAGSLTGCGRQRRTRDSFLAGERSDRTKARYCSCARSADGRWRRPRHYEHVALARQGAFCVPAAGICRRTRSARSCPRERRCAGDPESAAAAGVRDRRRRSFRDHAARFAAAPVDTSVARRGYRGRNSRRTRARSCVAGVVCGDGLRRHPSDA